MRISKCVSTFLIVCISMTCTIETGAAQRPDSDVELPVKRFIDFYFRSYGRGLPERAQLPKLASFLAPSLLNLFDAAMKGEECYAKKDGAEGPALIEGDLFSSLFEGATSATHQQIDVRTDTAIVEIEWTNDGKAAGSSPFIWKDRIFLVKTNGGWLISDFVHLGTWEFMMKGNVSDVLRDVAKECDA